MVGSDELEVYGVLISGKNRRLTTGMPEVWPQDPYDITRAYRLRINCKVEAIEELCCTL